jgi:hypothetical protein
MPYAYYDVIVGCILSSIWIPFALAAFVFEIHKSDG